MKFFKRLLCGHYSYKEVPMKNMFLGLREWECEYCGKIIKKDIKWLPVDERE